jgi:multisubunit Na+/H+ antiporter MnhB subunit
VTQEQEGMTLIVKTIGRLVINFILLFGIYIILYGHITPGGGFPGGVIVATAFILLMLSFGRTIALRKFGDMASSLLDNIGALSFLVVALLGFVGGYFFLNFINRGTPFALFSAGTLPLSNIAIGLKVSASLYGVFVALAIFGKAIVGREQAESEEYRKEHKDSGEPRK